MLGEVIVDTYDRFLMSQTIEAGIVGVMIFAGYSLVGLPYAGLVRCGRSTLIHSVYRAVYGVRNWNAFHLYRKPNSSTHFTCRLYDRSNSGRKCRLSDGCRKFSWFHQPILTLAAALIGGNLFGLVGMIFFIPILP